MPAFQCDKCNCLLFIPKTLPHCPDCGGPVLPYKEDNENDCSPAQTEMELPDSVGPWWKWDCELGEWYWILAIVTHVGEGYIYYSLYDYPMEANIKNNCPKPGRWIKIPEPAI